MKIQWFTLVFLMFGMAAYANGMHPKHEPNFSRLAAQINVSEDQMDAFLTVMKEQHEQRKEIHKQGRDAVKSQMDALRDGMLSKLETVLTPAQIDQLKQRMEKKRQKREQYRMLNGHKSDCCKQRNQQSAFTQGQGI